MDILSYLSELIQTRKAVGISGLGTVLKIKIPGRYDAETHSFVPPGYTLDFTTDLKEEVSLPDLISKKRNVSAETANYFISEFSEEIQRKLNADQEADLGDLGKLIKNDGQLKLVPSDGINYGFDFYGLPVVKDEQEAPAEEIISHTPEAEELLSLPAVEEPTVESVTAENESLEENPGDQQHSINEDLPTGDTAQTEVPMKSAEQIRGEIEAISAYRSKQPLKDSAPLNEEVIWNLNDRLAASAKEQAKTVTAQASAAPTPVPPPVYMPQEEEQKTIPAYVKVLLGILILAIMMATAYFVKPEWFSGLTGNHPAAVQKVIPPAVPKSIDSIPVSDTIAKDSVQDNKTATIPAVEDSLVKTPLVKPLDTAVVYEIIGASMHDQKEADNFISLMQKSGVTAKVVTNMSGKKLKISIATLKDEASAKLELGRLSKKLKIPGIYIYRNKQK